MFTFLPKDYRSEVLREHRTRLVIVCLGMLAAALLLGAILAFPTYLAVSFQKSSMIAEQARSQKELDSRKGDDVTLETKRIKAKLAVLSLEAKHRPVVATLERILAQPRIGVSLAGITLHRDADKGVITLQGEAKTRESLVAFSKSLQGEPSFSRVDLPVSSLAKSENIAFTIRIESNF
ncbi:MAG: PilN domain-containing protein [Candidatus Paceibacterota bacterium]|jgi:hypothetical protein